MYAKLLVSFAFTAFGIVSVHSRVCNEKTVIESKPLTLPSGNVITVERFNCSSSISKSSPARRLSDRRDTFELNTKRAASQCTMSNCMCGVPCLFQACRAVSQPIQATHCTQLAAQLAATPGTLTVPTNEGLGFILQSCEYTVFGSETEPTQYCFDDMGNAAMELFAVCGTQQADCEGTSQGQEFFVDQISL